MLLVIDHRDSFTWNLVHLLGRCGERVQVVQSEEMTAESVRSLSPSALVLSPGPGHPEEAQPTLALVRELYRELPILGVCLGHQILCSAFGARVVHAAEVKHGRVSRLRHDGEGLFTGLPSPLEVARYHSWVVERRTLPSALLASAVTEAGELMAVRHRALPLWSVQFHPESFLTPSGLQMAQAFVQLARAHSQSRAAAVNLGRA